MKHKVRILKRDQFGVTVSLWDAKFTASTKKEARAKARRKFPLPTFTLGWCWAVND